MARLQPLLTAAFVAIFAPSTFAELLIEANFRDSPDGFVYADDTFLGTHAPDHASGETRSGFEGVEGALTVVLGARDPQTVHGISAGWSRSFELPVPTHNVEISFQYRLTQAAGYESDEYGQVMLSLDGETLPGFGPDYIARLTGNGDGGREATTGWQTFSMGLGTLDPGRHVVTLGAYNNKKTAMDEWTRFALAEVRISGEPAPPCRTRADCDDANACTDDRCSAGVCQHEGNSPRCPDGFRYDD